MATNASTLIDGLSPRSGRSERCRSFAEVEQCHFIGVGEDEALPSQTVPAALKISYRLSSPFSSLFYCTVTTPIVVRGPDPTRNDHKTPWSLKLGDLNTLRLSVTVQVDHGPASPSPTLQSHLLPRFPRCHSLHPAPMLVDLLLLAAQQTQKDLDSATHGRDTYNPEINTVTPQNWSPHKPWPFVGSPAEGLGIV